MCMFFANGFYINLWWSVRNKPEAKGNEWAQIAEINIKSWTDEKSVIVVIRHSVRVQTFDAQNTMLISRIFWELQLITITQAIYHPLSRHTEPQKRLPN